MAAESGGRQAKAPAAAVVPPAAELPPEAFPPALVLAPPTPVPVVPPAPPLSELETQPGAERSAANTTNATGPNERLT